METIAEMFDLRGQTAIVTGGGHGIGRAIAGRLAEAGAGVMIADVNLDAAAGAAQEIRERGGRAQAAECDVSVVAQVRKTVEATVQAFGGLHILVNNAGVTIGSKFLELTEEVWDRTIDVNLKGTAFFSQAAAQAMIRAGHGGRIISIGSGSGIRPPGKDIAHYCTSKGAIISLTRAMAKELTGHGIRCNTLIVSMVKTFDTSGSAELAQYIDKRGKTLPLGRWGEPDDIARIVLFMASSASDYITGGEVSADGGIVWTTGGSD